ncbi:hypothetical protein GCM10023353_08990 [Tomitella cavernea]|uniref:Alpha/beta hydrolase n=1 Tax=Tomitella cavernea TaxID=1387982 RepID=A0ABP9CEK7_9ACTN
MPAGVDYGCRPDMAHPIGYRRHVAPKPKSMARSLSRRGPHRVLRGDLAFAGLPGVVCTPESGFGLPAVVFGHGWLTPPRRYLDTLAHVASWGFVVVAPATECGAVPSARSFAQDLGTAADIATSVRLGPGQISVHPAKVAMAGHGFGAGAAVLAAGRHGAADDDALSEGARVGRKSQRPARPFDPTARRPVAAVTALFPAPTSPSALPSAGQVHAPALLLSEPGTGGVASAESAALAAALAGTVTTRIVPAAEDGALAEDRRLASFFGLPGSDKHLQATTRACLTGFLLAALTDSKEHAVFTDEATVLPGTAAVADEPADPAPPSARARMLGALAGR